MNLVGIWTTESGNKTEIIFKNGFYYARHLESKDMTFHKHNRRYIEKYLKQLDMKYLGEAPK